MKAIRTSRPLLLLAAAAVIGQACTKAGSKPAGASASASASAAPSAAAGASAGAVTTGAAPRAEITETVFDAGTVERGVEISHAFEVKNVGQADLTVDAKPG